MRMSPNGRAKLKQWEGVKYTPYQDEAGVWTNGVGHTGLDVIPGHTVDDAQVDQWLAQDLRTAEGAVNRLVKVELSQGQFDALVSFVFNVGAAAFAASTLLKRLNTGDYDSVPAELAKWNKITLKGRKVANRGLSNRRAAEAGLWASGSYVASSVMQPAMPSMKPVAKSKTMQGVGLSSFAGAGSIITDSAQQIQVVADYSTTLRLVFVILMCAGVALSIWGYMRQRNEE
jgi:lysozyme